MISTQVNNVLCPKAYVSKKHNVKGFHSLPLVPVTFFHCPPLKFRAPLNITTNALRGKQSTPVCLSGGEARAGNENQEPLWKSFGKAIENLGKKSSVEDVLKQQIKKQEYYDEGGSPPGGRGGGSGGGGGGFGDLSGSDEEGYSGILDETIQVILATLGFIFLYMYIINGAEMTRLAKDYIKYMFGGKKSVRLTRALYQWERFRKNLTETKEEDRFWLEKAIIRTPTWWDHPEKYRRILKACMQAESRPSSDREHDGQEYDDHERDDHEDHDDMNDEF